MSNFSIAIYWTWMIAANEAYFLKYDKIEPIHFFLGALKLIDISRDLDSMLPDISDEEKQQIIRETDPLFKILVEDNKISITEFRRSIRKIFVKDGDVKNKEEISRSDTSRKLFEELITFCKEKNQPLNLKAFLYVVFLKQENLLLPLFKARNIDFQKLRDSLFLPLKKKNNQLFTSDFGRNLTQLATENKLNQAIGRDKEIREIGRILLQKNKPNALIIGDAGVGKTAVVETLAIFISQGNVPDGLRKKELFELSLVSLLAGAKYKGDFEERLNKIITEASNKNTILFIDEFHNVMGAGGGSEGTMDVANILKPVLARGDIQVIGATTIDEYRKHIEKDPAIERRFQIVYVNEPTAEQAFQILTNLSANLEQHYHVKISPQAIKEAIRLSMVYMPTMKLPDKAISVIESACSRKLYPSFFSNDAENKIGLVENTVDEDDVYEIISKRCNIPIENLSGKNKEAYLNLENELKKDIIGQDHVIKEISETIRIAKAGLNQPNQPNAVFFFIGPTGVGKTAMAKSLSRAIFGSEESIIRFDMSEFQDKHHVNKFIGAPPGYVGFGEDGALIKQVKNNPFSVILFDEIEKAHQDIQNVFLQILDNGTLKTSDGKNINFRQSIIIFTSNLGAGDSAEKFGLGFNRYKDEKVAVRDNSKAGYTKALKSYFKPEFLNRLHKILIFDSITFEAAIEILNKLINELNNRLQDNNITLQLSDEIKKVLLERGYSREFGVRNLQRVIAEVITEPLSKLILSENITNATVQFMIKDDKICITHK